MRFENMLLVPATAMGLVVGLAALPAAAQATPTLEPTAIPQPTANPWQMRHWPRTQPWQRAQPSARTFGTTERRLKQNWYRLLRFWGADGV